MATLKEVYELLKQKQKDGEDIGMFGESYLEMIEDESDIRIDIMSSTLHMKRFKKAQLKLVTKDGKKI
jgi:hypothetical protein